MKKLNVLVVISGVVRLVVESVNYVATGRDGTAPIRKRATTKQAQTTTIGAAAAHPTFTRKWHTQLTEIAVSVVANLRNWFTTWTGIGITAIRLTSNHSASVVIRLTYMIVPATCLSTLRRYSQCPVKAGNYMLNYGEGPKKLAKTLGVSVARAKELMAQYFEPYPKVQEFIEGVHAFILDHAMVETILGRPRRFHEMVDIGNLLDRCNRWQLPGSAKKNLARTERQSLNSIIQGSASDVAKMAMIKCEFDPRLIRLGVEMLLQVHDELIFEVPEENAEEAQEIIKDLMEHPFGEDLLVPLTVDCGTGYSWASAKA